MRNTNDPIGNPNRDLAAYSAVHQPTAPPRTPKSSRGADEQDKLFNVTMFVKLSVEITHIDTHEIPSKQARVGSTDNFEQAKYCPPNIT
jgi:hypothetical protein